MSRNLDEKREHLEALEAFIKSPAHAGYIAAIEHEIQETVDSIIAITPDSLADMAEEFQLRGELRCLRQGLTRFEDGLAILKHRIDEIVETELQDATHIK